MALSPGMRQRCRTCLLARMGRSDVRNDLLKRLQHQIQRRIGVMPYCWSRPTASAVARLHVGLIRCALIVLPGWFVVAGPATAQTSVVCAEDVSWSDPPD